MNFLTTIGVVRTWRVLAVDMTLIDGGAGYSTDVNGFFSQVIVIAVALAVIIAVILVAGSGYTMISSSGDPTKLKDAKEQLQNAILGLLLILGSVTIVSIVFNLLGISGVF